MKKEIKNILSLVVVVSALAVSDACKKNDDSTGQFNPAAHIPTSVSGRITDLNDQPVSNALVSDGRSTTTSGINGEFILKSVQLRNSRGSVSVIKAGYFPGARTFYGNNNTISNVSIKLIPKVITGSFEASTGGTINVWGGGTVFIDANSVMNATTGSTYNGNVSVSTFYLNPADHRFNEYMPGDLLGITSNNEEMILQSFGMVSVEMTDAIGQKLQLAPGKTAVITFPIPPNLQAKAPENIPLWYFDENKGLWIEQGIAHKQNNIYKGIVTHFSFWNCDLPARYVHLSVTFKGQKGIPLANYLVTITSAVYGTRAGYTDNHGTVSGVVPSGETLVINVFNHCREIIYTQNIGPFTTDINLGNIMIETAPDQYSVTFSGSVINCNNSPVTNGFVQVTAGSNYFSTLVTDGNFTITFFVCINVTSPVIVTAYDLANNKQSVPQFITVTGSTDQNIGQLKACVDYDPTKISIQGEGLSLPGHLQNK